MGGWITSRTYSGTSLSSRAVSNQSLLRIENRPLKAKRLPNWGTDATDFIHSAGSCEKSTLCATNRTSQKEPQ
jgi:hypothetical protein